MRTRVFGGSGLEVSELVFGGGWVGGILIHGDDDTRRAAIRRALDAGVNWIDTAASYGDGKSEEALGWLLAEIEDRPYLSTKVTVPAGRMDDIMGAVEESLAASLRRLRRDSVDLLQLHNPIAAETGGRAIALEQVLAKGGAADALERLRDQGLTRLIGLTALGETAACRAAIDSGRFDSAQVYYNLLNPSAARAMPAAWRGQDFGGLLEACRAKGMAVMAIRVLASGVLATDQRHGREVEVSEDSALDTEQVRARAALTALGLDPVGGGTSPWGSRAQTALRFALSEPGFSCAVIGLADLDQLDQALDAAGQGPLPAAALAKLEPVYAGNFALG